MTSETKPQITEATLRDIDQKIDHIIFRLQEAERPICKCPWCLHKKED